MNIISDVVVYNSTSTLRSTLFQKVMGFMTEISIDRERGGNLGFS
jgi:hypothetical protein